MRAAIVIDDYKLPTFEAYLLKQGFTFTKEKGPTNETLALIVETEETLMLTKTVRQANQDAQLKQAWGIQ